MGKRQARGNRHQAKPDPGKVMQGTATAIEEENRVQDHAISSDSDIEEPLEADWAGIVQGLEYGVAE